MVRIEELQEHAQELCKKIGLPACKIMIHIDMDDYVGIIGENEGGCIVIYEVGHPERYCVSVKNTVLNNKELVYDTLHLQVRRYKEFLENLLNNYQE